MIGEEQIRDALAGTVDETSFEGLGTRKRGKVRDSYKQENRRVLITTDRISAFDRVLGTIPFKGQVLNQTAAFWFEKTSELADNHVLDVPDPNVMTVKECEQLALEFVVRGYITGVTKTSLWYNYEQGKRELCGNKLPDGLRKDQKLDKPILTPTTKFEEHDRPISREQAVQEGLITPELFDEAAAICFKLYEFGVRHAAKQGLILVDTKYELGRTDGRLIVTDEIHTPDSSRYWYADTYEALFAAGKGQRKIDKEYVREWLADQGFRGEGEPPKLPDDLRVEAARRYIEAYETVSGLSFQPGRSPVCERIEGNLREKGYLM